MTPIDPREPDLMLTNLYEVPGRRIIEHYGLVHGGTVRAKHLGRDFFAGFQNAVGGELTAYTELMNEARAEAVARMKAQARELGANAVVGVYFTSAGVAAGAVEILAYGTAVRVEPS
jgi:uncharacterized protein YbjQ (UPF0145 family)